MESFAWVYVMFAIGILVFMLQDLILGLFFLLVFAIKGENKDEQ